MTYLFGILTSVRHNEAAQLIEVIEKSINAS
jgi:hypothetical protein